MMISHPYGECNVT